VVNKYRGKMKIVRQFIEALKSASPFHSEKYLDEKKQLLINDRASAHRGLNIVS
jgi:hypothetical protein